MLDCLHCGGCCVLCELYAPLLLIVFALFECKQCVLSSVLWTHVVIHCIRITNYNLHCQIINITHIILVNSTFLSNVVAFIV